jgi:hypothetical protein
VKLAAHLRSNAVACLAVFVALCGTSYAAVKVAKNSVGPKQIKASAVNSSKVKNGSLQLLDFGSGKAPAAPRGQNGAKGDTGDRGPVGTTGVDGEHGQQGPPGDAGGQTVSLNAGDTFIQQRPNESASATPITVVRDTTFTTDTPNSTVILEGSVSVLVGCSNHPCEADEIGAYIDGVGVPGTRSGFSGFVITFDFSGFPLTFSANGAAFNVGPAGTHHLVFGYKNEAGGMSVSDQGGTASVLVIGQ